MHVGEEEEGLSNSDELSSEILQIFPSNISNSPTSYSARVFCRWVGWLVMFLLFARTFSQLFSHSLPSS